MRPSCARVHAPPWAAAPRAGKAAAGQRARETASTGWLLGCRAWSRQACCCVGCLLGLSRQRDAVRACAALLQCSRVGAGPLIAPPAAAGHAVPAVLGKAREVWGGQLGSWRGPGRPRQRAYLMLPCWLGRCAVSPVGRLDVRVVRTAQCGAPVCWQAGLSAPAMSAHGRVDDASSKGGRAGNAAHLSRGAGRACAGALHGSAPLFVARSSVRRLWAQHSARAACSPAAARTAVRRGPRRGRPADAVR